MKKVLLIISLFLTGCESHSDKAYSDIYLTTTGEKIGEILFTDTSQGLNIKVNLQNLPQGEHGFHIHENPNCEAAVNKDGKSEPALSAGGHYDPENTGKHLGPNNPQGHKGDLPYLTVDKKGEAKTSFYMPNLKVKEVKNHSIMIHADGDNYKDTPKPLGGGGARIACGIIK